MKTDWYTKSLLTVIAVSLAAIAAQPFFTPIVAKASGGVDAMGDVARHMDRLARSVDRMESYGIKVREMPRTTSVPGPTVVPASLPAEQ